MPLTKHDLDLIRLLIDERLDIKLEEKLKYLPTKDEFYTKMDEIMGELRVIREEQSLLFPRVYDHENRIEKVPARLCQVLIGGEQIHPAGQHAAV